MTTENQFNDTAEQPTGMMAKNKTNETNKQQNMIATDQAAEVAETPADMATEKQKGETTEKKIGKMDEKEIVQAAQEKAKEEEEKLSGLWEIRARFKNLAENILPKKPYLMGVPSKIHITRNEGPDWRRGTPFSPHEERVQYVSFQRLDDDATVLRPQSWDEENAKSSQSDSTRRTSSEFSSLPGQTPRKKMSMEEYLRRKKPDSESANASREGSMVPHKAEAKVGPEGNMGPKIKPKISPLESTVSKMEGKAMQGCTLGPKAQETPGVAPARKETTEEKKGALKNDVTIQKETTAQKEVTMRKEASVQRDIAMQKANAVPKEALMGEMIANENEVAKETVVQPTKEGILPSRKRPIEAVAPTTDLKIGSGHPAPKKARIFPTASILDESSPPRQTNAHGFPPLLSPTLPSSIEEELANLQTRANDIIDYKEDSGETSDERTTSFQKELRKPDATSQYIPPIALAASSSISTTSKQPESNGPKTKIAEAARDSMFFGQQPRRAPQPKKPEIIPQPKQNAKKPALVSKAEADRLKITQLADAEGQPKVNARKPDLITKPETPSKINEHPIAKRAPKDVGSDPKGPALTTPAHNSEHREKKSLIVTLKIPRSKRKACQALLRFSPRPRKPNGIQPAPATAQKEHNKREAQTNAMEKQVETNQTAQKRPAAPVTPSRQEKSLAKSNSRGQKRPPGENEDPEPLKKRLKPSEDGDKLAVKTLQSDEKDHPESSRQGSRPKDTHDRVEKRSRPAEKEDLEPSKKRPKLSDDVNPVLPALKPPKIQQSDTTSKSHTSNPKGDVKSAKMRRIASLDGEVKTPSAAIREGTPTVPGSAERANREGRPTWSTTSAALSEEAALWRVERQKYIELGTHLKHELDGMVKKGGVLMKDPMANKKGCPTGVESILCYMLGFTALDELGRIRGKPGTSTAWDSLLPHINYVKAITSPTSHIYGLILQLEGICRNTIHSYDLDRLEREPSAVPPDFANRLVENARSAHKAWLAGTTGLSINDLQRSFPKTWAKRADTPTVRTGQEKLVPGKFVASGYYLPLASTSTVVEAVRMGWSFLAEWAEMEGVEWRGQMF